jgi:hypothetical protein
MPSASSATASKTLQATPDGTSLIQLAFQHNHWAAVPLLIQAGAPWPQGFHPPTWAAAHDLKTHSTPLQCLEVSVHQDLYT